MKNILNDIRICFLRHRNTLVSTYNNSVALKCVNETKVIINCSCRYCHHFDKLISPLAGVHSSNHNLCPTHYSSGVIANMYNMNLGCNCPHLSHGYTLTETMQTLLACSEHRTLNTDTQCVDSCMAVRYIHRTNCECRFQSRCCHCWSG